MFLFAVISCIILIAATIAVFVFTEWNPLPFLAAIIVGTLLSMGTYAIGFNVARDDAQTFNEYWDGYETAATKVDIKCERDGQCVNEYNCDPYIVMEKQYYTDSNGDRQSREVATTKYHDCPYSTQESSYYIDSTIGSFTVAQNLMTGESFRVSRPMGAQEQAPEAWVAAKNRIDSNNPGPVTAVHQYKNFLLASEATLFKKYEGEIEQYQKEGLIVPPANGVIGLYDADKAYFVGNVADMVDAQQLTQDVSYLGGAIGNQLQGDIHVVFVPDSEISSSTDYSNSLLAYWQSKELGRNTVAKNAIIVVVGVGKGTIKSDTVVTDIETPTVDKKGTIATWVKAFTGMPVGNEAMLTQIQSDLTGHEIDDNFIGSPSFDLTTQTVKHSDGLLESVIFGDNRFERVSMSSDDEGDNGAGFEYLQAEYELTGWALTGVIIAEIFTLLLVLAIAGFIGYNTNGRTTREFFSHLFTNSSKQKA
jgi:hypothetical protein